MAELLGDGRVTATPVTHSALLSVSQSASGGWMAGRAARSQRRQQALNRERIKISTAITTISIESRSTEE